MYYKIILQVIITLFLMATCVHCFIRYPGYSYYPRHPKSIGYNSYNNLLHYSRQIPNQRQRLTGYNTGFINAELASNSIHHDIDKIGIGIGQVYGQFEPVPAVPVVHHDRSDTILPEPTLDVSEGAVTNESIEPIFSLSSDHLVHQVRVKDVEPLVPKPVFTPNIAPTAPVSSVVPEPQPVAPVAPAAPVATVAHVAPVATVAPVAPVAPATSSQYHAQVQYLLSERTLFENSHG